jgi:hypothetical protein
MRTLIPLIAVLASAVVGYYFTQLVLFLAQRRFQRDQKQKRGAVPLPHIAPDSEAQPNSELHPGPEPRPADSEEPTDTGPDSSGAKSALRGGMWIGILERMLITGFIMVGQFAGVAVVIAIKGLGRYPELNARTSERFIIGTLASLLWASACGLIAVELM